MVGLDLDAGKARDVLADVDGVRCFGVDVTDAAAVGAALADYGADPDLLVNAAGIVMRGPVLERSLADFRRVMEVNFMGAVVTMHAIAPAMVRRGSGVIINIASIVGAVVAGVNVGAYAASKAALAAFSAQMAMELRPFVRVNAVAPGMIDAGIGAARSYADPESLRARIAVQPAGRMGTAEEIAGVVAFLASDAAGFINAQTITVDGGLSTSILAQIQAKRR